MVEVEFVSGEIDSTRLAQHIRKIQRQGGTLDRVEVRAGGETYEGAWVRSVRPNRLDISIGGMISQFEGSSPEEAAEKWAREWNVVSRVASRFVGASIEVPNQIGRFEVEGTHRESIYFENRLEIFWADLTPEDFDMDAVKEASEDLMENLRDATEEIRIGGTTATVHPSYDNSGLPYFIDSEMSYIVNPGTYFDAEPDLREEDLRKLGKALSSMWGKVDRALHSATRHLRGAYTGSQRNPPIEISESPL